jgi:hypothetical protein
MRIMSFQNMKNALLASKYKGIIKIIILAIAVDILFGFI